MVEFINNNIIIKVRSSNLFKLLGIKGLNRHEKMIKAIRRVVSYKKLTEI